MERDIDLFSNRIHCYNPLTNETLAKMADDITDVTKDILPDQKIRLCCIWLYFRNNCSWI
jgi:hypothetical protein